MKTLLDVKTEIAQVRSMADSEGDEKILKKYRKQLQYLSVIKNYLEESPSIDYLSFELKRISAKIAAVEARFKEWLDGCTSDGKELPQLALSEAKKKFNKDYDVPHLKEQLKALKYILKK